VFPVPSPAEPRRRRSTAKQRAVLEVLREQENFRSAQQLYLDLRRHRQLRIGLTSVYRILRTLAADRIAETQRAEDGEILYRLRTWQVIVTTWSAGAAAEPWDLLPSTSKNTPAA
jgi:Fur family transcriptional regulator, ferric uptake regulator